MRNRFAMLGIFGPLLSATLITAREGGRPALRQLYSGLLRWRVPTLVLVVALLAPMFLQTGILWLLRLAGREGPITYIPDTGRIIAGLVIAVAEEVGWRGFALPRLQKRMAPFGASGGSLFYTWFYNRSGGSLLLAVLAHFCIHLDNPSLALPGDQIPLVVSAIVYGALGLALMLPSLKVARGNGQRPADAAPRPLPGHASLT